MSPALVSLPPDLDDAFAKMLELPPEQRLLLSDMLASSVPQPLSEAWSREIDLRVAEIEKGEVKTIPAEDVFRSAREQLRAAN